jgi:hypothetical protein
VVGTYGLEVPVCGTAAFRNAIVATTPVCLLRLSVTAAAASNDLLRSTPRATAGVTAEDTTGAEVVVLVSVAVGLAAHTTGRLDALTTGATGGSAAVVTRGVDVDGANADSALSGKCATTRLFGDTSKRFERSVPGVTFRPWRLIRSCSVALVATSVYETAAMRGACADHDIVVASGLLGAAPSRGVGVRSSCRLSVRRLAVSMSLLSLAGAVSFTGRSRKMPIV